MDKALRAGLIKAKGMIEGKAFEEAVDHLEVLMAQFPGADDARLMYGLALKERGRVDEAVVQFERVLESRPNDVNALNSLAKICKAREQFPEEAGYLQKVITILKGKKDSKHAEAVLALFSNMQVRNLHADAQALLMATDSQETEITPLLAEMFAQLIYADMQLKVFKGDITFLLGKEIAAPARFKLNPFFHRVIEYCRGMDELKYDGEAVGCFIINMREKFPWANVLLYHMLAEPTCLAMEECRPLLIAQSVEFLVAGYLKEKSELHSFYQASKFANLFMQPEIYLRTIELAKLYLAYVCYFHYRDVAGHPWLPPFIAGLRRQPSEVLAEHCDIALELQNHVLSLPVRIKERIGASQPCEKQISQFRRKILELQRKGVETSAFEYLLAMIGIDQFREQPEVEAMKNTLKERIRRGQATSDTYRSYYLYLMKIARQFKVYDESIPLADIAAQVLEKEPEEPEFKLLQCWLAVSKGEPMLEVPEDQNVKARLAKLRIIKELV